MGVSWLFRSTESSASNDLSVSTDSGEPSGPKLIFSLPDDLLCLIFSFVDDLRTFFISIPCVCHRFKAVLSSRWPFFLTQIPDATLKWFKGMHEQGFDIWKSFHIYKRDYAYFRRTEVPHLDPYFVACFWRSLKYPVQHILETSTNCLAMNEEMNAVIRVVNVTSNPTKVYIGEIGKGMRRPIHHNFEEGACFFVVLDGRKNHQWSFGNEKGIGSKYRLRYVATLGISAYVPGYEELAGGSALEFKHTLRFEKRDGNYVLNIDQEWALIVPGSGTFQLYAAKSNLYFTNPVTLHLKE